MTTTKITGARPWSARLLAALDWAPPDPGVRSDSSRLSQMDQQVVVDTVRG